jgi:alcohol dehydrogenase class IV
VKKVVKQIGYQKLLVVTNHGVRRAGLLELVENPLEEIRVTFTISDAFDRGRNLNARINKAMVNNLARMVFSNSGVTAAHTKVYPLGTTSHPPHGVVNGLLLPYMMDYNLSVKAKELAEIAKSLGERFEGLP